MTLNITILTPTVIYQSGDYKLSDPATGKAELMPSTKAVGLRYKDWTAFLTYTGIGRVGGRHTADFVSEWLRGHGDLSFAEAIELLRQRGSSWLNRVARGARHTFVVAAFVQDAPVAAIISNFQKWHGSDQGSVAPELFATEVRANRKAEVIVTGLRSAVSRHQRRDLERAANRHSAEPLRIRTLMSEVTRAASQSFPNLISADSFVQSLDQHGRGQQGAAGNTRAVPHEITHGIDLLAQMRPFLDKRFGKDQWSLVGGTSGSSDDRSAAPPPCELKLVAAGGRAARFQLAQLAGPGGNRAQPKAINSKGEIVGEGVPFWLGPSYPCMWRQSGELVFLPHLGGLGGMASGITDATTIVGGTEMPNRHSHACKWLSTLELVDLGSSLPSHSGARSINSAGDIAGWSSIHPAEGGQAYFRPTIWSTNGEPRVLADVGGIWGEAIDINDVGAALVMTHDNRAARALLWQGKDVVNLGFPDHACVSFFPAKVTPAGTVLGTTYDAKHHRGAAVRYPDGRWERVSLPPGAHLTCGTDSILAGAELVAGCEVPWIWTPGDREPAYLPYYVNHYNRPLAVGADGRILGTASADYCCHPVIWTPG
jgi:hypothetical protein